MSYQHKENSGSVFNNDRKETSRHPDYTGSANIGSKEYYVSMWENTGSKGIYYALKFKEKDEQRKAEDEQGSGEDVPF